MLDRTAMQLVRNQLDPERTRLEHSFEAELQRVQNEAAIDGRGNSPQKPLLGLSIGKASS